MAKNEQSLVLGLLKKLLKPVARWSLQRNLKIHDIVACLKEALVETAQEELEKNKAEQNVSRISLMTGLYRVEVKKLWKEGGVEQKPPKSVTGRALVNWEQGKKYKTKQGKPRELSSEELHKLIQSITIAVNSTTVIFELERSGAIEQTAKGWRLVRASQILSQSAEKSYSQVGDDIESVLTAAEENIHCEADLGNLHHRTVFDNIYLNELPAIKEWLLKEGREFHRKVRAFLAEYDADIGDPRPPTEVAGCQVVVGIFSHCKEPGKRD